MEKYEKIRAAGSTMCIHVVEDSTDQLSSYDTLCINNNMAINNHSKSVLEDTIRNIIL